MLRGLHVKQLHVTGPHCGTYPVQPLRGQYRTAQSSDRTFHMEHRTRLRADLESPGLIESNAGR